VVSELLGIHHVEIDEFSVLISMSSKFKPTSFGELSLISVAMLKAEKETTKDSAKYIKIKIVVINMLFFLLININVEL
jgi:hypothetical protein